MLDDRPYMREGSRHSPWPVAVVLMVVLVVTFALQCVNDVYIRSVVEDFLALTPWALRKGYVWQFFTFQFLHVDIVHLLCNLLGLWFFGRFAEDVLGKHRFLLAYFGSGIIGGLLQAVLMVVFPGHFAPFVFGASAGIMGVFAVFCRLEAKSQIRWYFILPIRADVLLWITMGISLFFTLVPSMRGRGTAHAAHLGGLLAGIAFVKLGWHQDFRRLPWMNWWTDRRARGETRRLSWRSQKSASELASLGEVEPEEFISQEVDPILDKISAHGIHSLTEREKKILERARAKMSRR